MIRSTSEIDEFIIRSLNVIYVYVQILLGWRASFVSEKRRLSDLEMSVFSEAH